jgi:transposase
LKNQKKAKTKIPKLIKIKENVKLQAEKSIKIRIFPTITQTQTLKKWFGVRRWIYNRCLYIMKENYKKVPAVKTTQKMLRELVIKNSNYKNENKWMLEYEFDLRDEAMRDVLNNLNSNLAKGKGFDLNFKSKKEKETLSVLSKKWNKKKNFYSSVFKPENMKSSEPLPKILGYTSRLIKTETKKYYFCMPAPLALSENQAPENSMIFIDPGVKTFVTGYDPSGKVITWGERDVGRIARLLHYQRKLQSKIKTSTLRNKKKNLWRIANLKIGENIRNLVSEMHKKLSKWLCENYENIYLPRLNFHNCKNLDRKSKAKLASLSHCSFLERLKNKTREFSKVHFYEVNEAFTSKTCSSCGYQKHNLKNNDTYNCNECSISIGRDINASRNIMQRYFTKRALVY